MRPGEMTVTAAYGTARLCVEPIGSTAVDLDRVAQIATPTVTRHLPDRLQIKPGMKPHPADWVAALRAPNAVSTVVDFTGLIGFLTLREVEADHVMIGYLFAESTWGNGYATELVAGLVSDLESRNWQGVLRAAVASENAASARVLLKCGFAAVGRGDGGLRFYERRCGAPS